MPKDHLWNNYSASSFWVDPSQFEQSRIDAWFYQPQFIENEIKIKEWADSGFGEIKRLGNIAFVNYGYMPTEDYWESSTGTPFLRVTNFSGNIFTNINDLKYVNPTAKNNQNHTLKFGDTLVVQCGNTTGRIAIASKEIEGFVFPSFCLRVRPTKIDKFYLAALFDSSVLQTQIQRSISVTSVRPNTTKPAIESLLIPFPDPKIQQYLGRRVDLAEKCRNESSRLQANLDNLLKNLYQNVPSIDAATKQTVVTLKEFDSDRIDSWHYQRHYIDLNKWLKENMGFDRVSRFASLSKSRWNPKKETNPQFIYIEISNIDTSTCALSPNVVEVSNAPSRARKLLKSYDVLISTVRPNRGAISVVPKELNGAVASTGFAVLRTKCKEDAYFLGQILKHPISIAQMMRWNTGSTYPAIEEDVVLKIWVPGANEDLRKEIGELEMKRYWLQEKASKLVEEAKSDVEALIEGKLDTDAIMSGKLKAPTWEDIEKELEGI